MPHAKSCRVIFIGSEITELSIAELKQLSERLLGVPAPQVMTEVVEGTAGSAPEDSEVWLYHEGFRHS